jgi:lysophospholipase L1-like esterase
MRYIVFLFFLLQLAFWSCSRKPITVAYKNGALRYDNRIDSTSGKMAVMHWAGSSVMIKFKGKSVKALLESGKKTAYLNIVIDSDRMYVLMPDSIKKWYLLADNLKDTIHTVQIFKRTNSDYIGFYAFQLPADAKLIKLKRRSKSIEFIGDSITLGASINDTTADRWQGLFTDNYFTYGALTARYFNAKYYCIAEGGVGLMVGGNPVIAEEMYNRFSFNDSKRKWDFSTYHPDLIVINLFQNDSHIITKPKHPNYIKRFGNKIPDEQYIINRYADFIQKIKRKHPNAEIICTLGSMNASKKGMPWPLYIKKAVAKLNRPDVYEYIFAYKNSPGHPEVKDHKIMADSLIHFIESNNLMKKN